jgi:hypothetical protein
LLCSTAGNCLRCGAQLDATVVRITVLSREVRVHARCRDTFEPPPLMAADIATPE